ncbi:MAG: sigma-54 dependent transcriptional regulator [Pseudomonadales bacterium]|nr:sigma-54 dependent transcriptional regulator [Pseudomonadales bacterium]
MPKKNALIVDDEPDIRELLEITLGRMGIETLSAKDITSAKALLQNNEFDFCMTDMNLPDGNGIELVKYINTDYPQVPVAMITAHGSVDSAVEALKAGAFDFVSKPVNLELLRSLVDAALNLKPLDTKTGVASPSVLGETAVMIALRKQISILARSQAPIYISGESGSGKELVARSIHESGPRAGGPFIPVNCGAIPSELMESEFFGHTKGSFTGAVADKEGLFQAANGGTLFLDEVADLPLPMQVKLLRGIQEKAIRPIGSQQELSVHVRILSATHKDLTTEVERGTFRQDLFYRINVIELRVPSLRERAEDIPVLAEDLLSRVADDYQVPKPRLSSEAISELSKYHFPGNVRELANILERAITLCENDIIMPDNLQLTFTSPTDEQLTKPVYDGEDRAREPEVAIDKTPGSALPKDEESLDSYLENIEKSVIVDALETTRWNKTAAARNLGITFRALRYKLKKLGLD